MCRGGIRPSCGFPVGPFTPVWSDSLVGHHCMMYPGHPEAPRGRAVRAQRVLGLLGVGVGLGNDDWVPSLEGAVRGRWMRYKDWLLVYKKGQPGLPLYLPLSSTIEGYGLN